MAAQQRKAKKGRRSHDKDTGMFALTFLTITSFPATHAETSIANYRLVRVKGGSEEKSQIYNERRSLQLVKNETIRRDTCNEKSL